MTRPEQERSFDLILRKRLNYKLPQKDQDHLLEKIKQQRRLHRGDTKLHDFWKNLLAPGIALATLVILIVLNLSKVSHLEAPSEASMALTQEQELLQDYELFEFMLEEDIEFEDLDELTESDV